MNSRLSKVGLKASKISYFLHDAVMLNKDSSYFFPTSNKLFNVCVTVVKWRNKKTSANVNDTKMEHGFPVWFYLDSLE